MTLAIIVLSASIVVSPAQPAAVLSQPLQSTATGQTSGTAASQDQASQNQASQNPASQNQGAKQSQNPSAPSQTSQSKTSQSQTSQSQTSRNKAAKSPSSSTQKKSGATSGKKSSPDVAHKDQKAKNEGVNCNAPAGSAGAENKTPSTGSSQSTSASSTQASAPAAAGTAPASAKSSNCPPTKIVVPEGSTPESSIQLAGGAADPPARDNAKQLLQSTEDNLKKIEGQQLTTSQRDMVTQVRQFVAQSKKATEDGDVESARTLAWKAQTLSQELVTPENK
jgi:hypothetical protein